MVTVGESVMRKFALLVALVTGVSWGQGPPVNQLGGPPPETPHIVALTTSGSYTNGEYAEFEVWAYAISIHGAPNTRYTLDGQIQGRFNNVVNFMDWRVDITTDEFGSGAKSMSFTTYEQPDYPLPWAEDQWWGTIWLKTAGGGTELDHKDFTTPVE
jgi:hypothetical protein